MKRLFPLVFFFILSLLLSCNLGNIGYGVLLWSPSPNEIPHGSLVKIKSESLSNHIYQVQYKSSEMKKVDDWRVSFFYLEKAARKEQENLQSVKNLFIESLKDSIPVRSSQDNYTNNNIIYRLSENEIAKVLAEPSQEVKVGNLKGKWYKVLTQKGYRGYVFDYYLYVFNSLESTLNEILETDPVQAKLNSWANKSWHPAYYSFMARNRSISLPFFNSSYGLAFLPHQKLVLLTLPNIQLQFSYETLLSENINQIFFREPHLRVEEINSQELRVQFSHQGKDYDERFIIFSGDIKALREKQEKYIEQIWQDLSLQRKFVNTTAGTIILNPDNTYEWRDFSKIEKVLPIQHLRSRGKFDFNKNLVSSLQSAYKGVLTFTSDASFNNSPKENSISFLLDYSDNFLQLVYVPSGNIQHGIVIKDETSSPSFTFNRHKISE